MYCRLFGSLFLFRSTGSTLERLYFARDTGAQHILQVCTMFFSHKSTGSLEQPVAADAENSLKRGNDRILFPRTGLYPILNEIISLLVG